MSGDLVGWLRRELEGFTFDVLAAYRRHGSHGWPLTARDEEDLARQLEDGGHLLPLPSEPAALANMIEVAVLDFLLERLRGVRGVVTRRGGDRHYPDLEVSGGPFGGPYAVDVKVARLSGDGRRTESRITLYTGNTYFRWPDLHWPLTLRPFADYEEHVAVVCLYAFDERTLGHVSGLEVVVQPTWRIASRQRSSTTREYIGAVREVDALREGRGEFETAEEFYRYWRRFSFRIPDAVKRQLDRLISEQRRRDSPG